MRVSSLREFSGGQSDPYKRAGIVGDAKPGLWKQRRLAPGRRRSGPVRSVARKMSPFRGGLGSGPSESIPIPVFAHGITLIPQHHRAPDRMDATAVSPTRMHAGSSAGTAERFSLQTRDPGCADCRRVRELPEGCDEVLHRFSISAQPARLHCRERVLRLRRSDRSPNR